MGTDGRVTSADGEGTAVLTPFGRRLTALSALPFGGLLVALPALPFGGLVTALTVAPALFWGELSGMAPYWFFWAGVVGTPFSVVPMVRAVSVDRRWASAGILAGALLCGGLLYADIGETAPAVWRAAHDAPGSPRAVGSWQDGRLVIRARPDRLTAYRVSDGTVAWRWAPPGRDVVCAMSRTTDAHTGLVGHAPQGSDCDRVTALALDSGQPRWASPIAPQDTEDSFGDTSRTEAVSAGHGLAVLPTASGWRAVGLADGRRRWSVPASRSCTPLQAYAGSVDTVVTVADCGNDRAPVLRTYAAGTGRSRLRVRLPAQGTPAELMVLHSDPLAVWLKESSARGTRAVLSYDRTGTLRSRIPLRNSDVELTATPSEGTDADLAAFAARPARLAVVTGGTLITSAVRPGDRQVSSTAHGGSATRYSGRLVAYSLADGHELWRAGTQTWVQALTAQGGQVWVLSDDQLAQVDPVTGHFIHDVLLHSVVPKTAADLWISGGGHTYAIVNEDGADALWSVGVARLR